MRKTRATGPLWAVKTGYIVISALFCVLGVVLFVMAERCVPWIGRALGIGMVVCGAVKLGGYFSRDLFRLAFQYDLAFGILLAAVGVITLCHPGEAMTFLCVMFGIPVLADGDVTSAGGALTLVKEAIAWTRSASASGSGGWCCCWRC